MLSRLEVAQSEDNLGCNGDEGTLRVGLLEFWQGLLPEELCSGELPTLSVVLSGDTGDGKPIGKSRPGISGADHAWNPCTFM